VYPGRPGGSKARVLLAGAEYGVAAGQACVFYADASPRARVLGGGWIESAAPAEAPALEGERAAEFAGANAPAAGWMEH
jgi:tRNA-specific 2-thiouridylase